MRKQTINNVYILELNRALGNAEIDSKEIADKRVRSLKRDGKTESVTVLKIVEIHVKNPEGKWNSAQITEGGAIPRVTHDYSYRSVPREFWVTCPSCHKSMSVARGEETPNFCPYCGYEYGWKGGKP